MASVPIWTIGWFVVSCFQMGVISSTNSAGASSMQSKPMTSAVNASTETSATTSSVSATTTPPMSSSSVPQSPSTLKTATSVLRSSPMIPTTSSKTIHPTPPTSSIVSSEPVTSSIASPHGTATVSQYVSAFSSPVSSLFVSATTSSAESQNNTEESASSIHTRLVSSVVTSRTSVISQDQQNSSSVLGSISVYISPTSSRVSITSSVVIEVPLKTVKSKITLDNETYTPDLQDPTSQKYTNLVKTLFGALRGILEKIPGFKRFTNIILREGSVIVEYTTVFQTSSDSEKLRTDFNNAIINAKGTIGTFSVTYHDSDTKVQGKDPQPTEPQPEPEKTDLPDWAFYTLIGAGCLLLILFIIVICLCVKLSRRKQEKAFPSFMEVFSNDSTEKLDVWDSRVRARHVSISNNGATTNAPMKELNGHENRTTTTWYSGNQDEMVEVENKDTETKCKSFFINQDTGL